jgi:esterase/lipase superfamily enzyme
MEAHVPSAPFIAVVSSAACLQQRIPAFTTIVSAAALLFALAGCATTGAPHMAPTPVLYKIEGIDLESHLPSALRTTKVPVFYATTRAPAREGEAGHYRDAHDDGLRLGVAQVALGEPGWGWRELVVSDRTSTIEKARPGRVERTDEFGAVRREDELSDAERVFIERINARLAEVLNPEIVVYIHGYKVTFDEVSVLMGSFAHYLGHGAMVAFQWPTGLRPWDYFFDCQRAERYVTDIERLIALLAKTRAEYVNIIVYSCGSPHLANALARLRARHPGEDREALARRYRIGNVIFAASDIDLKTFAREHVPPIMDLARQMIVYYSQRDAALGFSTLIAGASRLGRPSIEDLTVQDIERLASDPRLQPIDVTDVRGAHEMGGMRGHGYWYANEWISSDIVLSLRHPIPPQKRCLAHGQGGIVWTFPPDYERCLEQTLLKEFPQLRRTPSQRSDR